MVHILTVSVEYIKGIDHHGVEVEVENDRESETSGESRR